jgi:hypothetical protein
VVFRVARPTPDSIVNTERVVRRTQHSAYGRKTSCEPLRLNVQITHGTTTELTDGFRFVVALDASHGSVLGVRLRSLLQPRRLRIAPAAVDRKPMIAAV